MEEWIQREKSEPSAMYFESFKPLSSFTRGSRCLSVISFSFFVNAEFFFTLASRPGMVDSSAGNGKKLSLIPSLKSMAKRDFSILTRSLLGRSKVLNTQGLLGRRNLELVISLGISRENGLEKKRKSTGISKDLHQMGQAKGSERGSERDKPLKRSACAGGQRS